MPDTTRPTTELIAELSARCRFPDPGQPVDCAVSGGSDSSALVVLAAAAGCRVTAHHVDHGLRPESRAEADIVADLAARFDADFVAHRVSVDPGPNLQARARAARYTALPNPIATGHTLDDRAETMLINLVRGAGRRGLAPHRDRDRHPIIALRRHETRALCDQLGLSVVEDPTNHDPTHLRTRIRAQVLPLLAEVAGRDLAPLLDRQADLLADEDDLLDELAAAVDPTDARALAGAHPAIARRAVRNWITWTWARDHPPGAESIERVLAVARGDAVATEIEGGQRVHRRAQRLRLDPP